MKRILTFLSSVLLISCSSDKEIAGASTVETENACIINVVNVDSKPAANVVARIRPLWHVQGINDSDSASSHNGTLEVTTDSLGNIAMDSVNFETGYIEIIDGNAGIFKAIALNSLKKNKLTTMQMETLGSVMGIAELPESADYAWVQVYGTDKLVKTNKKGEFKLDSLPPASYQIRAIITDEQAAIGEGSADVLAGLQWPHSRIIPLDSAISNWMQPVAESTVVFVRLNADNFNFSETMKNGNDIRITDQSGNRLAFKKAFWNDSLQQAELQIRINGTSNVENIVMYWGKSAALDASTAALCSAKAGDTSSSTSTSKNSSPHSITAMALATGTSIRRIPT